jgi:hypothetical protein
MDSRNHSFMANALLLSELRSMLSNVEDDVAVVSLFERMRPSIQWMSSGVWKVLTQEETSPLMTLAIGRSMVQAEEDRERRICEDQLKEFIRIVDVDDYYDVLGYATGRVRCNS